MKEVIPSPAKETMLNRPAPAAGANTFSREQLTFLEEIRQRILSLAGGASDEAEEAYGEVVASLMQTGDIPEMGALSLTDSRTGRQGVIFFDTDLDSGLSNEEKMILMHILPPFTKEKKINEGEVLPAAAEKNINRKGLQLPPLKNISPKLLHGPGGFILRRVWEEICRSAEEKKIPASDLHPLLEKTAHALAGMDRCIRKKIEQGHIPGAQPPQPAAPVNKKGTRLLVELFISSQKRGRPFQLLPSQPGAGESGKGVCNENYF